MKAGKPSEIASGGLKVKTEESNINISEMSSTNKKNKSKLPTLRNAKQRRYGKKRLFSQQERKSRGACCCMLDDAIGYISMGPLMVTFSKTAK